MCVSIDVASLWLDVSFVLKLCLFSLLGSRNVRALTSEAEKGATRQRRAQYNRAILPEVTRWDTQLDRLDWHWIDMNKAKIGFRSCQEAYPMKANFLRFLFLVGWKSECQWHVFSTWLFPSHGVVESWKKISMKKQRIRSLLARTFVLGLKFDASKGKKAKLTRNSQRHRPTIKSQPEKTDGKSVC